MADGLLVLVEVPDPDEVALVVDGPVPLVQVRDAEMVVAFDRRRQFGRVLKGREGKEWMVRVYGADGDSDPGRAYRALLVRYEELAAACRSLVVQLEGAWWLQAADAYARVRELTGPGAVPPIDPGRWAGGGGS